jgi:hypothetical protein
VPFWNLAGIRLEDPHIHSRPPLTTCFSSTRSLTHRGGANAHPGQAAFASLCDH